jgi:hypothetical protein
MCACYCARDCGLLPVTVCLCLWWAGVAIRTTAQDHFLVDMGLTTANVELVFQLTPEASNTLTVLEAVKNAASTWHGASVWVGGGGLQTNQPSLYLSPRHLDCLLMPCAATLVCYPYPGLLLGASLTPPPTSHTVTNALLPDLLPAQRTSTSLFAPALEHLSA